MVLHNPATLDPAQEADATEPLLSAACTAAVQPGAHRLPPAAQAAAALGALHPHRLWQSGITCILGAAFCFSWAASFVKLIEVVQPEVSIFLIIVVRSVLAAAASIATARRVPLGSLSTAPLLALRGLTGAASMTLFYAALQRIPLADATTLMFLNPAICAMLGWALLHEKFGWKTAAGCLASLAGVVCVAQPPFLFGGGAAQEWNPMRLAGVAMGALSAFFAAGSYITVRFIGAREPAVTIAFAFHLGSLITSMVPLGLGIPQPAVVPGVPACACMLGIAACSFTAQLLLSRGFQLETATKASAANFTQVLWGHVIGMALFHEPSTPLGIVGALLVVAGVVAVSADKHPQQQRHSPAGGATQAGKPPAVAAAQPLLIDGEDVAEEVL